MNKKVRIYDNLLNQDQFTKAWRPEESFKMDLNSLDLLEKLKELVGVEICFVRFSQEESHLTLFQELEAYLTTNLLPKFKSDVFLFHMEYEALPKSKLRSFKGVTKGRKIFSEGDFIEKEILFSNETSLFASVIHVNKTNSKLIFENYLYDSERSFLLVSDNGKDIYNESFLVGLVTKSVNEKRLACVNYLPLVMRYCFEGDLIIRVSGDGNTEMSLQIFAHKTKLSYLEIIMDLID